jgi:4-hydroxybenzoate polyprenyltransferase
VLLDVLTFSSLWVAAAAAALTVACSLAMGIAPAIAPVGLAFSGTLVVYNIDRIRDLDRDRRTAPDRSAFVAAHAGTLSLLVLASGVAAAGFAVAAGPPAGLVLVPVALLGLLHRRIKHLGCAKSAYITASWVAVVAGVPIAVDPAARDAVWVLSAVACAVFANAAASNVRDDEVAAARLGAAPVLLAARVVAAAGAAIALTAPATVVPLAAVPLFTLLALLPFRRSERYGLVAVDGALLVGAAVAAARLWR